MEVNFQRAIDHIKAGNNKNLSALFKYLPPRSKNELKAFTNEENQTLLQIAIELGDVDSVKVLIENDMMEPHLLLFLFVIACCNDSIEVVKYLAAKYPEVIDVIGRLI